MKKSNRNIQKVKTSLMRNIHEISESSWLFSKNPSADFTRNRKLPFEQMIKFMLYMSGKSIADELIDYFDFNYSLPSTSAFVQQRSKILPEAFDTLFHMFTESVNMNSLYKGYRLLAVDGSDVQIPTNPDDKDSYYPGTNGQRPYNLLHLNALYDLQCNTYCDAIVQKSRNQNEHEAFVRMVDRCANTKPTIFICDRGFESYNNMAHVQERGQYFLIRIKDGANGIANGFILPDETEFDLLFHLLLSRKQTKDMKELYKIKNRYKFIPSNSTFDYLSKKTRKHSPVELYELHFRIVRFKISDNTYETVVTNLDDKEFPPEHLKKLYAMRWGIETSFRSLKYTVGLLYFHSKKTESILQEIFARFTMYNFARFIISLITVEQNDRKHDCKINFSVAIHICREYIPKNMSPPSVEALLLKHVLPIRPYRKAPRYSSNKSAVSFLYRLS